MAYAPGEWNTKQLKIQGADQFTNQKKKMLDAYDRAREEAKIHKVETYHGNVAEAEFRKWLTDFLPRKFGVTSGYIVSQAHLESERLPHFDVIIFNALESPVLWVESNTDASSTGWARAIPAEHVVAVLEIKSAFNAKSVKAAVEHLSTLKPLQLGEFDMKMSDEIRTVHPIITQIVFFELRKEHEWDRNALNNLAMARDLPHFAGGIILRGQDIPLEYSALLNLQNAVSRNENNECIVLPSTFERKGWVGMGEREPSSMLEAMFAWGDAYQVSDTLKVRGDLKWGGVYFARFAFDFIDMMNGVYSPGRSRGSHGYSFIRNEFPTKARKNKKQIDGSETK